MLRRNSDRLKYFGHSLDGQTAMPACFSSFLISVCRITTYFCQVIGFQAVLFAGFGSTLCVAQELKMRIRVVGTDGLQAVKDGEVHVDVYDTGGTPVTSYHERRKFIEHRTIFGDNISLPIPKAGQYKVVATAIQEEDIPNEPWEGMNAPVIRGYDSDERGCYTIAKIDPKLKEAIPGGTATVEEYRITKRYRLMASSSCLTYVSPDETDGNEDDVFIVVPMQEYVDWWRIHCKFVASKIIELPIEKLVPGGSVKTEVVRSVAGTLLVTGAAEAESDHFMSADTVVDVFSGAAVTLAFHAAGGPQKIVAELAITYIPPSIVEKIGAQVVVEGVESDDYEHEMVSSVKEGESGGGEGHVVVRNHGPSMRNARVQVTAPFHVSPIEVSDVIAEIPTNAERRIPWKLSKPQVGTISVRRFRLAYDLQYDNVPVPQRYNDTLTNIRYKESPDPVVRISVDPELQDVNQGNDAVFRIGVRDVNGKAARGVNIAIKDGFAKQSYSCESNADGESDYRSATNSVSPGRYEFVFDSETAEQPVNVGVVVLPEAITIEVAPSNQTVKSGNEAHFEVIVKKLDGSPATFEQVSVEDPFFRETRPLSTDLEGKVHYESQSKNDNLGSYNFTFSSPGADVPSMATVLVQKEPTLRIEVEPKKQTIEVGQSAEFEVRVTKLDGSPAAFTTIAVADPYLQESRSLTTDAKGMVQYNSEADTSICGSYQFTFSSPDTVEPAMAEIFVEGGETFPPDEQGLLDAVLLFDKSGSMQDDIESAKKHAESMLKEMQDLAAKEKISLRVGLVTFCTTEKGEVFEHTMLTDDVDKIKAAIEDISLQALAGDEDLNAALMYSMNETVDDRRINMGWRSGAAKIALPITDEPTKEDKFTQVQVAIVAEKLDPVHVYPLVTRKTVTWLDSTVRSLRSLAEATGGKIVQVESADELPVAVVSALKLAIRRHREEIYRQENPPYLLYGVAGGFAVVLVCFVAGMLIMHRRRPAVQAPAIDSDLTGDTAFRPDGDPF